MTRRGSLRKRWDQKGRPWYMVCSCIPGVLYRVGPSSQDLQKAQASATQAGWTYDPDRGWACPECGRREVNNQLDMCLAKAVPSSPMNKNREQGK